MFAASRVVFTLCVLESHLWLTHCQDEFLFNRDENYCHDITPKVEIKSQTNHGATLDRILRRNKDTISIKYDSPLTVTCVGTNATILSITKNGAKLQTEVLNDTSISWMYKYNPFRKELKEDRKSQYVCTDSDTGCEFSIVITAGPAFVPTLQDHEIFDGTYVVPYGKSMSLLCFGPDANRLLITKDGQRIPTEKESETSIKWVGTPDLHKSIYFCTDIDNTFLRREEITVEPAVYIKKWHYDDVITENYLDSWGQRHEHVYNVKRGDRIHIYCTGPRRVMFDGRNNNLVKFGYRNETTRKLFVLVRQSGESIYSCYDQEFPVHKSNVRLVV